MSVENHGQENISSPWCIKYVISSVRWYETEAQITYVFIQDISYKNPFFV